MREDDLLFHGIQHVSKLGPHPPSPLAAIYGHLIFHIYYFMALSFPEVVGAGDSG